MLIVHTFRVKLIGAGLEILIDCVDENGQRHLIAVPVAGSFALPDVPHHEDEPRGAEDVCLMTDLKYGWFLELKPREPYTDKGLTLVGCIVLIDPPRFGLDLGGGVCQLFRMDNLGEICVRELDRVPFDIGRMVPPEALH
jgi:hypothetical protein